MAINSTSKDYLLHLKEADLVTDVVGGDTMVKAKTTTYVPMLSDQKKDEYDAYLKRPSLTNYSKRVRNGLLGLAMMHDPELTQKSLDDIIKDIDTQENHVIDFAEDCLNEVITKGRVGILVDMSGTSEGMTIAQAKSANIRPKFVKYDNTSILSYKYENINNRQILSRVILSETITEQITEFEEREKQVYRVLSLIDGVYTSRLYDEEEHLISKIEPRMNGKKMKYIPFYALNSYTTSIAPATPILFDVANKNLTHFKLDVDLYHGLHFTALPTPYIAGVNSDGKEDIRIGSTAFKVFDNPQAKMEYLEFKGQGLSAVTGEKEKVVEAIRDLASNILQQDKNTAEAAETIRLRNISGNASLLSVTKSLSRTIEKALNILAEWAGVPQEVLFTMNTNFATNDMSPENVKQIVTSWLSNGISDQEKFLALKKEKLIEPDKTFEEHQAELSESATVVK